MCDIRDPRKVPLAFLHCDGSTRTMSTYLYRKIKRMDWPEFKQSLIQRFGPTESDNPFGKWTKLEQTGSVRDYLTNFNFEYLLL